MACSNADVERIPTEQLASLRRAATVYEAGAVLAAEGESSADLFLLVDGVVRIVRGGREVETIKSRGAFFGHLAYFTNSPRSATIEVLAPTRVVRIHGENIAAVLSKAPSLALRLVVDTARILREREQVRQVPSEQPTAVAECLRTYIALMALQLVAPADDARRRAVFNGFLADLADAGFPIDGILLGRDFIPERIEEGKVRETLDEGKMKALQAKRQADRKHPDRALLDQMSFEF
jgi:CRP-like cAMP-binding protein